MTPQEKKQAKRFEEFSTAELRAELVRRTREGCGEKHVEIVPCDECIHFHYWEGPEYKEVPKDWKPCKLGHKPHFHLPAAEDLYLPESPWGYHRPNCKDRNTTPPEECRHPRWTKDAPEEQSGISWFRNCPDCQKREEWDHIKEVWIDPIDPAPVVDGAMLIAALEKMRPH